jgi:DMSO/TMAO reductase YedYZ molybdopterin-dependent catalytic subunit
MDAVITIRIPKETQIKMKKYGGNWSMEVRNYLESRLKSMELAEVLDKIHKQTKHMKMVSDSTPLIREDRDSR